MIFLTLLRQVWTEALSLTLNNFDIIMRYQEQFWLIWNLVQWTVLGLVGWEECSDQITMYLGDRVLVITGPR